MEDYKVGVVIGWIMGLLFLLATTSYFFGRTVGYNKAFEDNRRIECEIEFNHTPYKDIDGKCLKYFSEKGE